MAAGYAVGSEFGSRDRRAWLNAAGGSPLAALVGKLAPYFGIFVLIMAVVEAGIIHGLYEVPFRGDSVSWGRGPCLLDRGLSVGWQPLQPLVRNLASGMTMTGIVCTPAFGFAGGVSPFAMGLFPRVWGAMLPLRWYIQILFHQAARGLPLAARLGPAVHDAGGRAAMGSLSPSPWLRLRLHCRKS